MSRFTAVEASLASQLDELITVRVYPRAWVGKATPDPSRAELTKRVWAKRQDASSRIELPRFVGGSFSADLSAGFLVRSDFDLLGRAPNAITVQTEHGNETILRRISIVGRRRFLVLTT